MRNDKPEEITRIVSPEELRRILDEDKKHASEWPELAAKEREADAFVGHKAVEVVREEEEMLTLTSWRKVARSVCDDLLAIRRDLAALSSSDAGPE